ncbi:MAG: hypothetical protein WA771_08955, partial [Chthoniobacterales bacterium]
MKIRIHSRYTAAILIAVSTSLHAAEPTDAVARVGDLEITVADIQPRLDALSAREQSALRDQPTLLNQFVRSLIVQQLVLRQAQAEDWSEQPDVAKQLEEIREKAITQTYLEAQAEPPESYPSD